MVIFMSLMKGHNYFRSPDYLVVQGWITAMLLYPTNIHFAEPNVHHYTKFFLRVVGYDLTGNTIVPCHRIVAVFDSAHHLVTTTFPVQ